MFLISSSKKEVGPGAELSSVSPVFHPALCQAASLASVSETMLVASAEATLAVCLRGKHLRQSHSTLL